MANKLGGVKLDIYPEMYTNPLMRVRGNQGGQSQGLFSELLQPAPRSFLDSTVANLMGRGDPNAALRKEYLAERDPLKQVEILKRAPNLGIDQSMALTKYEEQLRTVKKTKAAFSQTADQLEALADSLPDSNPNKARYKAISLVVRNENQQAMESAQTILTQNKVLETEIVNQQGIKQKVLVNEDTGEIIKTLGRVEGDVFEYINVSGTNEPPKYMITKNGEPIRNENGDIDFLDTLTEAEKETITNEAIFKAGGVLAEIDKAEQLIGKVADQSGFLETIQGVLLGSTGFGALKKYLPATEARTLANYLNTIRSNVGFDELRKLKDAGSSLGQVSNIENLLLQSALATLDQFASKEAVLDALSKIKQSYLRTQQAAKGTLKTQLVGEEFPPKYRGWQSYKIDDTRIGLIGPNLGDFAIIDL
mgnify:CR=1 FL=1